jgi:hypothetical protein
LQNELKNIIENIPDQRDRTPVRLMFAELIKHIIDTNASYNQILESIKEFFSKFESDKLISQPTQTYLRKESFKVFQIIRHKMVAFNDGQLPSSLAKPPSTTSTPLQSTDNTQEFEMRVFLPPPRRRRYRRLI